MSDIPDSKPACLDILQDDEVKGAAAKVIYERNVKGSFDTRNRAQERRFKREQKNNQEWPNRERQKRKRRASEASGLQQGDRPPQHGDYTDNNFSEDGGSQPNPDQENSDCYGCPAKVRKLESIIIHQSEELRGLGKKLEGLENIQSCNSSGSVPMTSWQSDIRQYQQQTYPRYHSGLPPQAPLPITNLQGPTGNDSNAPLVSLVPYAEPSLVGPNYHPPWNPPTTQAVSTMGYQIPCNQITTPAVSTIGYHTPSNLPSTSVVSTMTQHIPLDKHDILVIPERPSTQNSLPANGDELTVDDNRLLDELPSKHDWSEPNQSFLAEMEGLASFGSPDGSHGSTEEQ